MKPEVRINYQSIGSGAGVRQIINQTVDFAGSDAPMKDAELEKAQTKIQHIPTVMGAVVLAYNLPSYTGELKLTADLLVKIYSGKITRWNDPELLKLNPTYQKQYSESPQASRQKTKSLCPRDDETVPPNKAQCTNSLEQR